MKSPMHRVSMLPSLLTLGNFACGILSVGFCLHAVRLSERADLLLGEVAEQAARESDTMILYACVVVFIAMLFDMFDGQVARMTGAESHFGAELDSLADDCTFGVAPAVIVTTLWIQVQPATVQWWGQVMLCGVVYASCAILRLARYNVEVGSVDKNYFTGLPSPGAAGAVVSAVLFCRQPYMTAAWQWLVSTVHVRNTSEYIQMQARILGIYMLIVGLLMVTRLRFVHVANRYLTGHKRFTYLVAVVFAFFLFIQRPIEMLFFCFNGYVLVSLINNAPRMVVSVRRWFSPKMEALRARRAERAARRQAAAAESDHAPDQR